MKLSIITINYNDCAGLNKTINSVIQQTFRDFEYIVIDGGSTDGSAELLKQYSDYFSYWVSEKDHGIYNAMNKGLKHAKGEYCLFLNSGDFLYEPTSLTNLFNIDFDEDIISTVCQIFNHKKKWFQYPPTNISLFTFTNGSLAHPSTFIKTSFIKSLGGYRENFKIISDWCFFVEALIVRRCTYRYIEKKISCFNCFGISSTSSNKEQKEKKDFLYHLFPRIINDYEILNDEAIANVLIYLKQKEGWINKINYSIIIFPFKVLNRILRLRWKLGIRIRITKKMKK